MISSLKKNDWYVFLYMYVNHLWMLNISSKCLWLSDRKIISIFECEIFLQNVYD